MNDAAGDLGSPGLASLGQARYVSLSTQRRDGREVLTPVWIVSHDQRLYCYSAADAGKVKRIRRTGKARLASCNARGGDPGSWYKADARVVEEDALARAVYSRLIDKYGWQMKLANALAWLSGRLKRRAVLEFSSNNG